MSGASRDAAGAAALKRAAKEKYIAYVIAIIPVGNLRRDGADKLETDAARAVHLLERGTEEFAKAGAVNALDNLLHKGRVRVEWDATLAVELYECTIRERSDKIAMNTLREMLCNGVAASIPTPTAR